MAFWARIGKARDRRVAAAFCGSAGHARVWKRACPVCVAPARWHPVAVNRLAALRVVFLRPVARDIALARLCA